MRTAAHTDGALFLDIQRDAFGLTEDRIHEVDTHLHQSVFTLRGPD